MDKDNESALMDRANFGYKHCFFVLIWLIYVIVCPSAGDGLFGNNEAVDVIKTLWSVWDLFMKLHFNWIFGEQARLFFRFILMLYFFLEASDTVDAPTWTP